MVLPAPGGAISTAFEPAASAADGDRFASVGAFPLPEGSKDAAVIIRLQPGSYVAQASAVDPTESGQVLIEVYILP